MTHRCHNREFLLKFARDRDGYRAKLREYLAGYEVALLDYCITSNHVHLLLDAQEWLQISRLMRSVAGEFAPAYNRRPTLLAVTNRSSERGAPESGFCSRRVDRKRADETGTVVDRRVWRWGAPGSWRGSGR